METTILGLFNRCLRTAGKAGVVFDTVGLGIPFRVWPSNCKDHKNDLQF